MANVAPWLIRGLSGAPRALVSRMEWAASSLFVHVTVPPGRTTTGSGVKAKLTMLTAAGGAGAGAGGRVVAVGAGAGAAVTVVTGADVVATGAAVVSVVDGAAVVGTLVVGTVVEDGTTSVLGLVAAVEASPSSSPPPQAASAARRTVTRPPTTRRVRRPQAAPSRIMLRTSSGLASVGLGQRPGGRRCGLGRFGRLGEYVGHGVFAEHVMQDGGVLGVDGLDGGGELDRIPVADGA